MVETEEPQMTSQYGACALRAGVARLHARTRMHTPTCTGTHTHARTHKQTNEKYLLLFNDNNDSRTRLNVTLHVYCLFHLMLNRVIPKVTNGLETVKRVLKTVN